MVKVGYTEEAPGVKSTMRLAVLVSVFSGCFVVVASVFLMAFGVEGPLETLLVTGGGMALSAEIMKALQKNIERRIQFAEAQSERRAVYPPEPEGGGDAPPEQGDR